MKRADNNSNTAPLYSPPVSKSKLIVAAVLVAIMAFMWLRLLFFNKPSGASAAAVPAAVKTQQPVDEKEAVPELTYIQLPVVPGRHDVLTADVFRPRNGRFFTTPDTASGDDNPVDRDGFPTAEDIPKIEALITLDGIIAGGDRTGREAFINGRLVSVGSTVTVEYNKRTVELTVTEIHRNKVVLRVGEFMVNVLIFQVDP